MIREPPVKLRIAVVIPALDEAGTIADMLKRILAEGPDELVVVDGGSVDETVSHARHAGACVIPSHRGRGLQQNRGAGSTSSEVLLFLHADCYLEPGSLDNLRLFLNDHPGVAGGCFRTRVESRDLMFRLIDIAADIRAAFLGIPYGDQGIFVRREVFDRHGGFPEIPLMEDVFFSLRIRGEGRIAVVPRRIFVSPRRWQSRGLIRQSLLNWALTVAAAAGVSPSRLARFYPHIR